MRCKCHTDTHTDTHTHTDRLFGGELRTSIVCYYCGFLFIYKKRDELSRHLWNALFMSSHLCWGTLFFRYYYTLLHSDIFFLGFKTTIQTTLFVLTDMDLGHFFLLPLDGCATTCKFTGDVVWCYHEFKIQIQIYSYTAYSYENIC